MPESAIGQPESESSEAMAARVRASFERQAMMATLGARLAAVERGRVELIVDYDDRFTQQHGFLHAGAVASVLDSACGYAAFTVMPPDAAVLTAAYTINLLAPAAGRQFVMTGEVIRAGRTLVVCRGEATADGGTTPLRGHAGDPQRGVWPPGDHPLTPRHVSPRAWTPRALTPDSHG